MLQGLLYVSIHLFFIYSEEFTVFVKNFAVYHGHCNVTALCAVAQHGKGIKCGQHMGTVKAEGNDIRLIAYGYAANVVILNDEGKVETVVAAHDVGRALNPLSLEGQIEGGVVMCLGWALTEKFTLVEGRPKEKFGTLGLFRADQIPGIVPIIVEKPGSELACGAKGVGEISAIPAAPAAALAYWNRDGIFRDKLPLDNTPYRP